MRQVHPMPIITDQAAKGERHEEAGNSSPKRPASFAGYGWVSNCSHGDTEAGESQSRNLIDQAGRRVHAKCASQARPFRDSLLWIKRHGPLHLSRTNVRKTPSFHSGLVSCAAVCPPLWGKFFSLPKAYGSCRLSVIISEL